MKNLILVLVICGFLLLPTLSSTDGKYLKFSITPPSQLIYGSLVNFEFKVTQIGTEFQPHYGFPIDGLHKINEDIWYSPLVTGPSSEPSQCFKGNKRFGQLIPYKASINLYLPSQPSLGDKINCPIRIGWDWTQNQTMSIGNPEGERYITQAVRLPAPIRSNEMIQVDHISFTQGKVNVADQFDYKDADASLVLIGFKSLPRSSIFPIKFHFTGLRKFMPSLLERNINSQKNREKDDIFLAQVDDKINETLGDLITSGVLNIDAMCGRDIRLFVNTEGRFNMYIITGNQPELFREKKNLCKIPFSQSILINLFSNLFFFDSIPDWFEPSILNQTIEFEISVGDISTRFDMPVPSFERADRIVVQQWDNDIIMATIFKTIHQKTQRFEIISIDGVEKKNNDEKIIFDISSGSIFDYFQNQRTLETLAYSHLAIVPNSESAPARKTSWKQDQVTLRQSISTSVPIGLGVFSILIPLSQHRNGINANNVNPNTNNKITNLNLKVKINDKVHEIEFKPSVEIVNEGSKILSITNTEVKYRLAFKLVEQIDIFDFNNSINIDYFIAPSLTSEIFEIRSQYDRFPTCVMNHPSLKMTPKMQSSLIKTENVSNSADFVGKKHPQNNDEKNSLHYQILGPTKMNEIWTITCTQQLNPQPKPDILYSDYGITTRCYSVSKNGVYGSSYLRLPLNPGENLPTNSNNVSEIINEIVNGWDLLETERAPFGVYIQSVDPVTSQNELEALLDKVIGVLKRAKISGNGKISNLFDNITKNDFRFTQNKILWKSRKGSVTADFFNQNLFEISGFNFLGIFSFPLSSLLLDSNIAGLNTTAQIKHIREIITSSITLDYNPDLLIMFDTENEFQISKKENNSLILTKKATPGVTFPTENNWDILSGTGLGAWCFSHTQCNSATVRDISGIYARSSCYNNICTDYTSLPSQTKLQLNSDFSPPGV
jgi:hypothetical protein